MMAGFGTEIAKQIPDWAVRQGAKCKCANTVKTWNQISVDEHRRYRAVRIRYLVDQRKYLKSLFRSLPVYACHPIAARIVDKALERATQ